MYEMYPDAWAVPSERHVETGAKPRRRVRKEHSVLPPMIASQQQPGSEGAGPRGR